MKNYRIVQEELNDGTFQFAVEYQSNMTFDWYLVNNRDSMHEAQFLVQQLKDKTVLKRQVIEVYNAD